MLGLFLLLPVLALHARELPDYTPVLLGFAMGAYGLTQALLQIPFGRWSDRFGRKPVIAVGLALAGRMPPWLLAVTGMTALLMFVQTGLGYLGRDELEAAAWHVPLGVLIFGLAMWQFTASVQVSRRSRS